MRIPHPNANSNFYDRIMVHGPYNPLKGNCQIDNEVQQYTFEEWAQMRLSQVSLQRLERFGEQPAYAYKKPVEPEIILGDTTLQTQPPLFYERYKET